VTVAPRSRQRRLWDLRSQDIVVATEHRARPFYRGVFLVDELESKWQITATAMANSIRCPFPEWALDATYSSSRDWFRDSTQCVNGIRWTAVTPESARVAASCLRAQPTALVEVTEGEFDAVLRDSRTRCANSGAGWRVSAAGPA
jgi:hypothetical protein